MRSFFGMLLLILICPLPAVAGDWVQLSVGSDSLDEWTKVGGEANYVIKDGVITGTTGPGKNTFLTRGPYADFVL